MENFSLFQVVFLFSRYGARLAKSVRPISLCLSFFSFSWSLSEVFVMLGKAASINVVIA